MSDNLAADALQRLDALEESLEPLGLAEAHRPKFFAVRYQIEGSERARVAREDQTGA